MDSLGELTESTFNRGLLYLSEHDLDLARVVSDLGPPPMWSREPGFPTLVHIILEQQVSLASARAAFDRLRTEIAPLTPERFLELDDVALKRIGFSRQKTAYTRHLAESIINRSLDLDLLRTMDDKPARSVLLQVKGIGPWTADIYLLMALRRPDVWPAGDLALASAVQVINQMPHRPLPEQLDEISERWRPWRAVAARILWHFYLNGGREVLLTRLGM